MLRLVDEGAIDLDDPVVDYIPQLTLDSDVDLVSLITVRHLLTQTSGFESGWSDPMDWPDPDDSVLDEYLTSAAFAESHHLVAPPGDHLWQSSLGMAVAGLLVERVSGVPFPEHVRELFDELHRGAECAW